MTARIAILLIVLLGATTVCRAAKSARAPEPDISDRQQSASEAGYLSGNPRHKSPEQFTPDSIQSKDTERTLRLYDSIQSKTQRRAVPRMLYKMLFVKPVLDTTTIGGVTDESRRLEPFAGRRIGRIRIERQEVFDSCGNWLERTGNKLHILTRERVIRRDLLFHPGDELNPQLVIRNLQLLRSRSYIYDATVELQPDPLDPALVDIILRTRDSWTISIDAGFHSQSRTMIALSDANILGTGNKLEIQTNFAYNNFDYGGNMVEYEIPNVLGTFFSANFSAGRNFEASELKIGLRRDFLRTTDYMAGATYEDVEAPYFRIDLDTAQVMKLKTVDAWSGYSHYLRRFKSSIYLTGRYSHARFSQRPEVSMSHNPAYHDYDAMLFGLGLYREKFYTASMIYGFGVKEYLAGGYKAELVGGYSWGEFNDEYYMGATFKVGGFNRMGYMMGTFTLGTYIDHLNGMWCHSGLDINMQWFSNLFLFRRNRIRQFLGLSYTQGWNRGTGSNESIGFTKQNGLEALKEQVLGTNRMTINTETVIFTPYQPLGFRVAVFGFADFGLIGYSPNIFKNDFFTSFGLGIRLRNERLVFKTIQLRLGLAFGKRGLVKTEYFQISNQTRMEEFRYRPSRPEIVPFQ